MKKRFLFLSVIILALYGCKKEEKTVAAALKMQEFVIQISNYCKANHPGFIIIPQNGVQLAFNNVSQENGIHQAYLDAVDGFGNEEIFYDGTYKPDNYRLDMLRELKQHKTILGSDLVKDDSKIQDDIDRYNNEGFLCFPRSKNNLYYLEIPHYIINENTNDVTQLSEAKNFLYLINPEKYDSKTALINALKATNYDVLLIDLFFNDEILTTADIAQLKTKANGGQRLVLSYMNIGSVENYRYYWKSNWKLHHPSWIKKRYPGYKDEYYVEFWNPEWQNIIYGNENSYTDKIINAGFDGVYLDNVETYYFLYHRG